MENNAITFGQALRQYRQGVGLKQSEVEKIYKEITGSKILLSAYENNRRSPTTDVIFNLCLALGADYGTIEGSYYFVDRKYETEKEDEKKATDRD